ncbi:MAG: DUF1189 domain-containing protein [Anaerolineae bacterium]|nr:DUF1189 domain-containing protein [Anaerolineae bacterium]
MKTMNPTPPLKTENPGCAGQLSWLSAGFTLPFVSPNFYRIAVKRPLRAALAFFLILMSLTSVLMSFKLVQDMDQFQTDLVDSYYQGNYPIIRIEKGEAAVEGPDPLIIYDTPELWVGVDTTGEIPQIDQETHLQGILLTRSQLHIFNGLQYERISLDDLNFALNEDPIVIDHDNFERYAEILFSLAIAVSVVMVFLFNLVLRLTYLLFISLLIQGFLAISHPQVKFPAMLILGIYASLPAVTIGYLLDASGVEFPFLQNLLLAAFWGFALNAVIQLPGQSAENLPIANPLSWVALPVILAISANIIFAPPNGAIVLWVVFLPSLIALINTIPQENNPKNKA